MPKKRSILITFLLGFLINLPLAIPAYIYSSYLSVFTSEKGVGVVFALGSLLTIILFSFIHKLLSRAGNTSIALFMTGLGFLSFIGLAIANNLFLAAFAFILNSAAFTLIQFNLDIFLENSSEDQLTGGIRGIYMVCINAAWVISELLTGIISAKVGYLGIFVISGLLLIPFFLIISRHFKIFQDPQYKNVPVKEGFIKVMTNRDLASIYSVSFLLQFFYAWMVIYMPIYLLKNLGFSVPEMSLIFAIMLLPFVITEAPLGRLADKYFGEKEMLAIGFTIMALSSMIIPFFAAKSFALWASLLFVSRIGAAMVEIMTETYFFKKVGDNDDELISIFRSTRPWAYLVAPLLASLIFIFVDFRFIFLILGVIMIFGVRESLQLKDTK